MKSIIFPPSSINFFLFSFKSWLNLELNTFLILFTFDRICCMLSFFKISSNDWTRDSKSIDSNSLFKDSMFNSTFLSLSRIESLLKSKSFLFDSFSFFPSASSRLSFVSIYQRFIVIIPMKYKYNAI